MQLPTIPKKLPAVAKFNRLSKKHKITAAGAGAAAAVVLAVVGLEATAGAGSATAAGDATGFSVSTGQHVKEMGATTGFAAPKAAPAAKPSAQPKVDLTAAAKKHAAQVAQQNAAKKAAAEKAAAKKAAAKKAAAAKEHTAAKPASRSAARPAVHHAKAHAAKSAKPAAKPAAATYPNNLDGWIRQSLAIMHAHHIPGTYEGIHRNIIRESSGNPKAINLWDINARNGIPSKGLLQVINPTFDRYHVAGTSWNIYNPVANITAACNYAADRYGSMDNVNSAY
jgi:hypothetical protein